VRRPEDKQFILADRLRREQATPPRAPTPAEPSLPQLLAALQAQLQAPQPAPPTPAPPRDTTPGEGWTLPERRKFRFRLEDVAFE
jgi:hypothetical protein